MALRTKLVISFTALLLVVIAAVGVVASSALEGILVRQIDRVLVGLSDRGPGTAPPGPINEPGGGSVVDEALRRDTAEVLIDPQGTVVFARPSGFRDDPDPLPDITDLPRTSGPVELPAVDGSITFRAAILRLPDGATLLLAAPLTPVTDAVASLIRTLMFAGAGVLLIGAAATWWTVRQSMRPVEEMVDTAEAIAAGDLSSRVDETNPNTELGRLGGSLNSMLGHIEDAIAHERQGQERLRQFVGDASHELRTPVTAIAGYAELYRQGGLDAPEAEARAWKRIEAESVRMKRLIEDLLVLARLGQSQPLELDEVDVMAVARDAAADHAAIDADRPVSVSGPSSALIRADRNRLHQVVSGLLSNVRVHTPTGTSVEVAVSDRDDEVAITVTDTGPGIPDHALSNVFERFYRADTSRSRTSGGSGLGLAIVHAIVLAHGGVITAANGSRGGAQISLVLPRKH